MISNTNSTAHRSIYYKYVQQFHGEPQEEGFGVTFKLYYENGNIKYEGELQNGIPHGQGKSYYENGNIKYAGEWQNGKKVKN